MVFPLGVNSPFSVVNNVLFWSVKKNPGAKAFTRIPTFEKWTASHCVKFDTAAFAPLYAGIFVKGVNAFIEDIFKMLQPFLPIMSLEKTCVGNKVPIKFKLK